MAFLLSARKKAVATPNEDDVDWYNKLTPELWVLILSWVPVDTLLSSCKCVCMHWKYTIPHPRFIQLQLRHATRGGGGGGETSNNNTLLFKLHNHRLLHFTPPLIFNQGNRAYLNLNELEFPYDELSNILGKKDIKWDFLSTCKGVLCMLPSGDHEGSIVLLNLAAKRGKVLPNEPVETPTGSRIWDSVTFGFGSCRDSITGIDEFKVIRIAYFSTYFTGGIGDQCEVKLYSTGTDSWRRIGDIPCDIQRGCPGLFVCGALHWMGTRSRTQSDGMNWWDTILSFDIEKEEFREIALPPCQHTPRDEMILMDRKAGCLSLMHFTNDFEIWVMNEEGSWTLDCIIGTSPAGRPLGLKKGSGLSYLKQCSAMFIKGDQILIEAFRRPAFHNMVSRSLLSKMDVGPPRRIKTLILLDLKTNKVNKDFVMHHGGKSLGEPLHFEEVVTFIGTLVTPKSSSLRPLSSSRKRGVGGSASCSSKGKKK